MKLFSLEKLTSKISLFTATIVALVAISVLDEEEATADTFVISYAEEQYKIDPYESPPVSLLNELRNQDDPDVITFIAEHIVATETSDWPGGYRGNFLYDIAVPALISGTVNQIPPSVIIGQAIFESGWGRSRLAREYNNLFGIKGYGAGTVAVNTFEKTSRGKRYRKRATFKTFSNRGKAIEYHGKLLAQDRRYGSARLHRDDWRKFLTIASPYYASEPKYAVKVTSIIEYYNLDRWDEIVAPQGTISEPDSVIEVSKNVR